MSEQDLAHVPVGTQSTTNLIRNSEIIYKERSLELLRKAALRRRSRIGTEWIDIRLERLEGDITLIMLIKYMARMARPQYVTVHGNANQYENAITKEPNQTARP